MIRTIVDLNHDNNIDFDRAKDAGIVAIIHKATEGATFKDDKYRRRRDEAMSKGFLWGAYHFSSSRPVSEQVANFLDHIQWGDKPERDSQTLICLDFEPSHSGPDMTIEQAEDFVVQVQQKTHRYPMIYGAQLLRKGIGTGENEILKNCPLWFPRYPGSGFPEIPDPARLGVPLGTWENYTLWQYTDGDHGPEPRTVPGMGGSDRSQFNGTTQELIASWPFSGAVADNDFDATPIPVAIPVEDDFTARIASLGLRHFKASEILNPTFNVNKGVSNSRPPENVWPNIYATMAVLDEIRHLTGVPIAINSSYRSKAYNNTLSGAAPHSQHLDFRAIDFHSSGMEPIELAKVARGLRGKKFTLPIASLELVAEQAPINKAALKIKSSAGKTTFEFHGGVQPYNSFVHIDCRGTDAEWG